MVMKMGLIDNYYDFIIIGSGLFGCVFAREATDNGYKCLIVEKRNHIGGNVYSECICGINVHKYGPHIFNTNNDNVYEYLSKFTNLINFNYKVKCFYKNKLYSFPINLQTFYEIYGIKTPVEAQKKLNEITNKSNNCDNLEDFVINNLGHLFYEIFIKHYTIKQWGKTPKDLPSSIIQRIPVRLNFNDNYYDKKYSCIPEIGYTKMILNIVGDIDCIYGFDYFDYKNDIDNMCKYIVYTGPIDKLYDYKYGKLEYRSLSFDFIPISVNDYQGCVAINYTDSDISHTRSIEHKYFESFNKDIFKKEITIISNEYPQKYTETNEPFYPINSKNNNLIYDKYKKESEQNQKTIIGGRLGEYKYYNMDETIASSLLMFEKRFKLL